MNTHQKILGYMITLLAISSCRIPLNSSEGRLKDTGKDPNRVLATTIQIDQNDTLSLATTDDVSITSIMPSYSSKSSSAAEADSISTTQVQLSKVAIKVKKTGMTDEINCTSDDMAVDVAQVKVNLLCDKDIRSGNVKPKPDSQKEDKPSGSDSKENISMNSGKGTCACNINDASKSEVPALFDMPAKKDCRALIDASFGDPIPEYRKKYKICYYVTDASSPSPSPTPSQSTPPSNGSSTGSPSSSSAKLCKCSFVESKTGEMIEFKDSTSFSSCMAKSGTSQPNKAGVKMTTTSCKLQ